MAFGSSSNYFIGCNGETLTNLTITINISEDIVPLVSATKAKQPHSPLLNFQINCYSGLGENSVWQQYIFTLSATETGGKLTALIENWPSAAYAAIIGTGSSDFIKSTYSDNLANNQPEALLDSPVLLKNSQLNVTLGTDGGGNVTSATFNAYDPAGNQLFQNLNTIQIFDLFKRPPNKTTPPVKAGQNDVSPVVAVEVNIVGGNEGTTVLSSGAGTITYFAAQPLYSLTQAPDWVAYGGGTYETANSVYSSLPSASSMPQEVNGIQLDGFQFVQSFATVTYTPGQALVSSRKFGTEHTEVFAIGSSGQLTVFAVSSNGKWGAFPPIGPGWIGFAPPGAQLAVSQQFGLPDRTCVFVIDNTGMLNYFYYDIGNSTGWVGPVSLSAEQFAPPGARLATGGRAANSIETDVYVVDNSGTLQVFSVFSESSWSGPSPVSEVNFAPPGAALAVSPRYGVADQTDVYVAQTSGAINAFSVNGTGNWSAPEAISPAGFEAPPWANIVATQGNSAEQTDVYVTDHQGQITKFSWSRPLFTHLGSRTHWVKTLVGPTVNPDGSGVPFPLNGSPIAVSPQFGISDQTDVFVVDSTGALNVLWADGDHGWNGPKQLGAAALAVPAKSFMTATAQFGVAGQTDVVMMNNLPPIQSPGIGWPCVFWVVNEGAWNGPKWLILQV